MGEDFDLTSALLVALAYVVPVIVTELRKYFQKKRTSELTERICTLEEQVHQLQEAVETLEKKTRSRRVSKRAGIK